MILSKRTFWLLLTAVFFGFLFSTHPAFALESDLNKNGISDSIEASVTMTVSASLPAGEYVFNNLVISNKSTLTLEGDPNSANVFKGVKITAKNLNINAGSAISANAQGYVDGPGAHADQKIGASYGSAGLLNNSTSIYGDNIEPIDLGSGGYGTFRGGGAIRLIVTDTFTNNGAISANGAKTSSGGSIYVQTKVLKGNGSILSKGGGIHCLNTCVSSGGGGGRIAVYYEINSFVGKKDARGGCGIYDTNSGCSEEGTVAFLDVIKNDLYLTNTFSNSSWIFKKNRSPFIFNAIHILGNGSDMRIISEDNVSIKANSLFIKLSTVLLSENQTLDIKTITIDKGTLVLSGSEVIKADSLILQESSTIIVPQEKKISLTIPNIDLGPTAYIHASNTGYFNGPGSPDSQNSNVGASYGGLGVGNKSTSIYGNAMAPTDFGSGIYNPTFKLSGGGAIRLIVTDIFTNNGTVVADGSAGTSGGSIYITAKNIIGNGKFLTNGGGLSSFTRLGGGGRIAIYYENSSFTGTIEAKGGCDTNGICAGDGTVVMKKIDPVCGEQCFSNVLFLPGLMGSRLYKQDGAGEKELWVSVLDDQQKLLALNKNGKSFRDVNGKIIDDVYTKNDTQDIEGDGGETGIIDESVGKNIYKSFINDLKDWKTEGTINDYAFIPYDWRFSLEDIITSGVLADGGKLFFSRAPNFSQAFILKKLKELQASSKTGKVTIVTHSNGGLVAKALIQKLKETNNPLYNQIDNVILVAMPQVGTPKGLMSLLHGTGVGPFNLVMSNKRSRILAENMPAIYNLMPSPEYFSIVDSNVVPANLASFQNHPLLNAQIAKYGFFIGAESELKDYVLGGDGRAKPTPSELNKANIGNGTLYLNSRSAHQSIDTWQASPNTKIVQVAGWGEDTIAGLDYTVKMKYDCTLTPCTPIGEGVFVKPREVTEGDGTVVVPSALWMQDTNPNVEKWWVNLPKYNTWKNIDRDHGDILEIPNLSNFIKSKILGYSLTDPEGIVVNSPDTLTDTSARFHYTMYSSGSLGITDNQGRYTGLDLKTGKIREEIPRVKYEQVGDTQFISVPAKIVHTLKVESVNKKDGVLLDIDKKIGNKILSSTAINGTAEEVMRNSVNTIKVQE